MKFIGVTTDKATRHIAESPPTSTTPADQIPQAGDDRLPPVRAGALGRPAFRAHARRSSTALVPTINCATVRELAADQVSVERRDAHVTYAAEVLEPDRLNAIVFGGFAAVALAISIVGVAGVLAFSVSGRTREFGIRLAVGSQPREILTECAGRRHVDDGDRRGRGRRGGLGCWPRESAAATSRTCRLPGVAGR